MPSFAILSGAVAALSVLSLGGGLYEVLVVDAAWPARPDVIQPGQGGLVRRRFWMPVHGLFELLLLTALVVAWGSPSIRLPLACALGAHVVMRGWSFAYFIPQALAFETAGGAGLGEPAARTWCRRSRLRLPLDAVTAASAIAAFIAALR